jgi:hypothetical protein
MNRKLALIPIVGVLALAGCNNGTSKGTAAAKQEQAVTASQAETFARTQPVPVFDWSQLRQNLIELETAQARTTQTTSFFFNQGVADPVNQCPSIGFPIPGTYQLTNPEQPVDPFRGDNGGVTIAQLEATGVYTGENTGTYVMCIDAQGQAYAVYWEGFVQAVTGPATWDTSKHAVSLTGASSFDFTEGR